MAMKNYWRSALAAQLCLLLYLQVIEWIDLFPWNDIRRGNGQEGLDVVLGVLMTAALIVTYLRWRPGILAAAALYAVWLSLQVMTFWKPYVTGASERWARVHAANFAVTIQCLPAIGNHLPPDASHVVLQMLIAFAVAFTALLAWSGGKDTEP